MYIYPIGFISIGIPLNIVYVYCVMMVFSTVHIPLQEGCLGSQQHIFTKLHIVAGDITQWQNTRYAGLSPQQ